MKLKKEHTLCFSELQYRFKKDLSTTQCTFGMLGIIYHYNFTKSSVNVTMLDSSKAFSRLFAVLLKWDISQIVLRLLLLGILTNHCVQSGIILYLNSFSNEWRKAGQSTVTHFIYCVYRWLLERLENIGVGFHMGSRFVGVLVYADNITLLALCKSALSILDSVLENYAAEYYVMVQSDIIVKGKVVGVSDKTVHVGYYCIDDGSLYCITLWQLRTTYGKRLICLLQFWTAILLY